MLVNGIDVLREARQGGYAVGGFDVFDLESVRAVIAAAEAEDSPVFLQAGDQKVQRHLGFERTALIMRQAAIAARVPVAVHFDHGGKTTALVDVASALAAGFTSVMVDGSRLPMDENIALTRQVAEMAHRAGAGAEAEIGKIGRVIAGEADETARRMIGAADPADLLTSPEDAARLVAETGVDYVAVSIGSVSGTTSHLNLDRLRELAHAVAIPLVLHGGTGVPEDDLRQAARLGIAKVNIAHGIWRVYVATMRESLADGRNTADPHALLAAAREAMQSYIAAKIRQLRG
jgi:fructose-bisphosphate aldolase, class II